MLEKMLAGSADQRTTVIAMGFLNSPYFAAWTWNSSTGVVSQFGNATSAGTVNAIEVLFSPDGKAFLASQEYVKVYPFSSRGFGTKLADNTSVSGLNKAEISPDGNFYLTGQVNTPFIQAWNFSSSSGFGSKLSNPTSLISAQARSIKFSADGLTVAVSTSVSPYAHLYAWSSAGFGAKASNPTSYTGLASYSVAFHPTENIVVFAGIGGTNLYAYTILNSGFNVKLSDPATPVSGGAYSVAFSPDGKYIAVGMSGAPYIYVYNWTTSGFGSKFLDPTSTIPDNVTNVAFSPDSKSIVAAYITTSPWVKSWSWSSSGFGNVLSSPIPYGTGSSGNFHSIAFSGNVT